MLSLLQSYLPFFNIIPGNFILFYHVNMNVGIKQISISYLKLYKIKIECKYTTLNAPMNAS